MVKSKRRKHRWICCAISKSVANVSYLLFPCPKNTDISIQLPFILQCLEATRKGPFCNKRNAVENQDQILYQIWWVLLLTWKRHILWLLVNLAQISCLIIGNCLAMFSLLSSLTSIYMSQSDYSQNNSTRTDKEIQFFFKSPVFASVK